MLNTSLSFSLWYIFNLPESLSALPSKWYLLLITLLPLPIPSNYWVKVRLPLPPIVNYNLLCQILLLLLSNHCPQSGQPCSPQIGNLFRLSYFPNSSQTHLGLHIFLLSGNLPTFGMSPPLYSYFYLSSIFYNIKHILMTLILDLNSGLNVKMLLFQTFNIPIPCVSVVMLF